MANWRTLGLALSLTSGCSVLFDAGSGPATDAGALDANREQMSVTLVPGGIDFGSVALNAPSASFLFTAVATEDTRPLETRVLGTASSSFDVTRDDCAGVALEQGETCTMDIRLVPLSAGDLTAGLEVGAGSALLEGSGLVLGLAQADPMAIDFGDLPENRATKASEIVITNVGDLPITPVLELGNGNFVVDSNSCGELSPGATCAVAVLFDPVAIGSHLATLNVVVDGSISATVSISGNALPPAYRLTVQVTGGTGSVGSSNPSFTCSTTDGLCVVDLAEGSTITMKPSDDFLGWGGACSGMKECTVLMDADKTVTAAFP